MTTPSSLDEHVWSLWSPRHDHQKVDLAFVIDCTQSMGSYIRQAQTHISTISERISRSAFNVHLALVEYRDHPPEDRSFVTKIHNFTSSVTEMKGAYIVCGLKVASLWCLFVTSELATYLKIRTLNRRIYTFRHYMSEMTIIYT